MPSIARPYRSGTTVTEGDGNEDLVQNANSSTRAFFRTLVAGVTDLYLTVISLVTTGAQTVTRMNYFQLQNPTGAATITSGAVLAFDAAAGTHVAVDAATTKTTPGTVSAWVKINVNGTLYFIPAYTSKTS